MSDTALDTAISPLEDPPAHLTDVPFFEETVTLLRSVRDHDFDTLAALCDDDFGIVDAGPDQKPVAIRDRAGWEGWFRGLFGQLDALAAATDSRITGLESSVGTDMGFSVLYFDQMLHVAGMTATFDCTATIVWKLTPDGWREARWHVSILSADVPEALAAATG
jgi:hypothetical protein